METTIRKKTDMSEDKRVIEEKVEEIEVVEGKELGEEDLDEVTGGFYPWRPTEKPTRYFPKLPDSGD